MLKTALVGWLLTSCGKSADALAMPRGRQAEGFGGLPPKDIKPFLEHRRPGQIHEQRQHGVGAPPLAQAPSTLTVAAKHLLSLDHAADDYDPFSHIFHGLPSIIDGIWLAKSGGHFRFKLYSEVTARSVNVLRLLRQVESENRDLPNFGPFFLCGRDYYTWCERDMPQNKAPTQVAFTFGYNKNEPLRAHNRTLIPVPDCVFDEWAAVGIDDYEVVTAQMREAGRRAPLKDLVGWVGNPRTAPERSHLLDIAKNHTHNIEAIAMDWRPSKKGEYHLSHTGGYMTLPQQVERWAYLLEIEGSGYGFRFKLLMHSGRPILMQQYQWAEFWHTHLIPWEHFVPVAADLSDLNDKVSWLKQHPEEARKIGANAQAFALTYLTRPAAITAWADALKQGITLTQQAGGQRSEKLSERG